MNIEISASGVLLNKNKEEFTHRLSHLCEHENVWIEAAEQSARLQIGAEGIIILELDGNKVALNTDTLIAGPGFHAFVCSFIDQIQLETGVDFAVSDPTNYYQERIFETLKYQYFYQYLFDLQKYAKKHDSPLLLAVNLKKFIPKEIDGSIASPLGYISRKLFCECDLESLAERFFIWNNLEQDALFYRNNALYYIWHDCYFEYSAMNDETMKYANMVMDYTEIAYEKDPTIKLPWRLYQMLTKLLDRENLLVKCNEYNPDIKGYRCSQVGYHFQGWIIYASGFSELSFDSASNTQYINAPYLNCSEPWSWFVEARCCNEQPAELIGVKKITLSDGRSAYEVEQRADEYFVWECIVSENNCYIRFKCYYTKQKDLEMLRKQCYLTHLSSLDK